MIDNYSRQRLSLAGKLIKEKKNLENGRLWMLEPKHLRFRHGESIAELKVPYHMGAQDEARIEKAVLSLAVLLIKRFEPARTEIFNAPSMAQFLPMASRLREKTFRTDIFISGSIEKKIATAILSSTSHMDSAMLAAWLKSDGHGRDFVKWTAEFFDKTLKEDARTGGEEKTPYLGLLAFLKTLRKKKDLLKEFRIKGVSYEKVDLIVGISMFISFKYAIEALHERLKTTGAFYYSPSTEGLLDSAVVPKSFLSIPSNLLSTTLNPYGVTAKVFEILSRYPYEYGADRSELVKKNSDIIKNDRESASAVNEQYEVIRFREEALKYLTEFDLPDIEAHGILYELHNEDRLIRNFLGDRKQVLHLIHSLGEIKKIYTKDPGSVSTIESFQRYLSSLRKSVLGGLLRGSKGVDTDLSATLALEGCYACAFDDSVENFLSPMRAHLADRRGDFSQNIIIDEYNRGRLYRFSTDERPILKSLALEEEGQLFIDMKDFTRKILKLKEIAMAEFMKEHFYVPILKAAERYAAGTGVTADERGIKLTNMPGDAVIFSGGISYLIKLAGDIQGIIRGYRDQLLKKLPPMKTGEALEEVHRSFDEKRQIIAAKKAAVGSAIERSEPGMEGRLAALAEEEHRLEKTYRDELETAIKGELEAGLYISYGSKAEVIFLEYGGTSTVSIGEKINEAARGTFRNPMVRAKLEMLIENEKQKPERRYVKYPFDVYIDRIYSVKMPTEIEGAFEKFIAEKKPAAAEAMSRIMGNEFLNELNKIVSGESFSSLRLITSATDIYNKGQVISGSALEAYIKETKGTKWFFKQIVRAGDLSAAIREIYFLPNDPLELWFGVEVVKGIENIEVFYRSGEIVFRGFEAIQPIVVYEMLNCEGAFFKSLLSNHFRTWLEESKKSPDRNGSESQSE